MNVTRAAIARLARCVIRASRSRASTQFLRELRARFRFKTGPAETLERLKAYAAEDAGHAPGRKPEAGASRTIGLGSQILCELGAQRLRLLSSPKRYHALSGFKLEVVEYVAE